MAGWEKVALRHPSTVRVSKLLSVDKTIIKRVLGTASPEDAHRVEKSLRIALNLV
jgi:mRNA-degrading endonuclease toxin of MazEF toxin-antitoxin module